MTGDTKPNPTSSASERRTARPKASTYNMFDNLHQTRLKATEANRKRLLVGTAPAAPAESKE